MALTVEHIIDAVKKAADELGWGCSSYRDGNDTHFEFENTTDCGEDLVFGEWMRGSDLNGLLNDIDDYAESFDPDDEAKFYIQEGLFGKRGVPSSVEGILDAMKDAEAMLLNFANQMRHELEHLTEN